MKTRSLDISLIGIGTGNPKHLTLEAVEAIQSVDLILIPLKGENKNELAQIRRQICSTHAGEHTQVIGFDLPIRDEKIHDYQNRVDQWHDDIAQVWATQFDAHASAKKIAFLVWGDPSLYDSTLRIIKRLNNHYDITLNVIAGITAIQGLTSAHQIPVNTINGAFTVTTGRQLRDNGWPKGGADQIVVMLDGQCSFGTLEDKNAHIYWSAYVGMAQAIHISGRLDEVCDKIIEQRAKARKVHGWIMDIYMLTRQ